MRPSLTTMMILLALLLLAGILWWIFIRAGLEDSAETLVQQARGQIAFTPASKPIPGGTTSDGWTVLHPWPLDQPLTREAWAHLPPAAVRYFDRSGVLNQLPVKSFSLVMKGRIRQSPQSPWMDIVMRQYNHMEPPARVVFIRTTEGPMTGVDSWVGGRGRMVIRLFNLISLTDNTGPEMDISAQVTFLNDLVFCPLGYFSLTTEWKALDHRRVLLKFSIHGHTVEAELDFNEEGDLENWKTAHRWAEVGGKNVPDLWETPLSRFQESRGLRIPTTGRGVHNYDGNPYGYFEMAGQPFLKCHAVGLPGEKYEEM